MGTRVRRRKGALECICNAFAIHLQCICIANLWCHKAVTFFTTELLLKLNSVSKSAYGYFPVGICILNMSADCFTDIATKSFKK